MGSGEPVHYKVAEAARLAGVSASTLRLWEAQGLVVPGRSDTGHRQYSAEDVTRVQRIASTHRLTEDEARHSVDAGDVYVVLPEHPWWGMGGAWEDATPLPDGFAYTSDNNDDWLTADQLTALLA